MVIHATQKVDVILEEDQRRAVTAEYLRERAGWKDSYFVNEEDGWVYDNKVCHTSHSFEMKTRVRVATAEDRALHNIFANKLFNL
jgi:hypothetical protein